MSESKQKKTNYLPIILVGFGLMILIGAAVFQQASKGTTTTADNPFILPPIEVDQPAPELTLSDLEGNQVSLSDFAGEVVLVNNWATWCPPCRQEMPEFQAYYEKYHGQGFQIVAVEAGQPKSEVEAFVKEQGLDFVVLLDPENQSLVTFQNNSLPNSWVIDRRGNLRLAWLGAINLDTLEAYVTPLLEEK
jgi:peroxiredoxin